MTTYATDQARQYAELSAQGASTTTGLVVSISWPDSLVTVNIGGLVQSMPWVGPPPWVNDRVRVVTAGGLPVAELVQGAPFGTVVSVDSDVVVLTGDDGVTYRYFYVNGDTLATDYRVALDHARRFVLGRLSTDVDPTPPIPDPTPEPAPGALKSAWFTPAWSGNWRSGAYSDAAATISTTRVGAYGYGSSIADTVPDGAVISRAELYLTQDWDKVPGTAGSMGVHAFDGRPGSAFASNSGISGTTSVPGGSRTVDIRGAVADALKTGSARGVAFRAGSTGWRQYSPTPASGRIYMEWSS